MQRLKPLLSLTIAVFAWSVARASERQSGEYLDIADPRTASVLYDRVPRLEQIARVPQKYKMHEFLIEPLRANDNPLRREERRAERDAAIRSDSAVLSGSHLAITGAGTIWVGEPLRTTSQTVTLPILTRPEDRGIPHASIATLWIRRGPANRSPTSGFRIPTSEQLPFSPFIDFGSNFSTQNFPPRACAASFAIILLLEGQHGFLQSVTLPRDKAEHIFETSPKVRGGWAIQVRIWLHATCLFSADREGYFQYPAFEISRFVFSDESGTVLADVDFPITGRSPPAPWMK